MNSAERVLMMNLKLMNIIKDDDNMIWTSPYRDIIFEINRMENTMSEYFQEYWGKYIISITVKNNLGTTITEIRFSELDAVRILDAMTAFLEVREGYGDSTIIYINPNNSMLENYMFDLEVIPLPKNMMNDEEPLKDRDIRFNINVYSPFMGKICTLATMLLSGEELNNLAYSIFFVGLLDAEVDPDTGELVNEIGSRIMMQNY